jgi:hypothetical protein
MIEEVTTLTDLIDLLNLERHSADSQENADLVHLQRLRAARLAGENDELLHEIFRQEASPLHRVYAALSLQPATLNLEQVNRLRGCLLSDNHVSLQTAVARQLRFVGDSAVINQLFDTLIRCRDPQLRSLIAYSIAENGIMHWQEKVDAMLTALQRCNYYREQLDHNALIAAIRPSEDILFQNRFSLTDYLIQKAALLSGDSERVTGIMAGLIIESVGNNLNRANQRITQYENSGDQAEADLALLRSELNSLLTPAERQAQLEQTFTKPLEDASKKVRHIWESSLNNVETNLRLRQWLGMGGIAVGTIMLIIGLLFEIDRGPLMALIGVILVVASVIYSGRIQDQKRMLAEIGVANAVYTAYIQRTLEISNAYTHLYLHNQLTSEKLAESNELISKTMNDTVKALRTEGKTSLDDLLNELQS